MNAFRHTLQQLLAERALCTGPALTGRGHPVGFRELAEQSRRVALWLPNVPAWLASFFACAQLGAVAVSVNTRFPSREVGDIITPGANPTNI